jgi:hypothetical protein
MRLFIFHSPAAICVGFAFILAAYGLLIWLISGCLSFAKQTPSRNDACWTAEEKKS